MTVNKSKRGASRKPVRKQRAAMSWQQMMRNLLFVLVLSGAIAGSIFLYQDDTLPILHVTVEGKFIHVNKEKFIAAVSPYAQGSFMRVDVAGIRTAGEALPWVKQIQIRRVWPDSLHFIVDEQSAIARWGNNGLINDVGEAFFPPKNTFPMGLTVLTGPENSQQLITERFLKMDKALKAHNLKVSSLVMDERRSWSMKLNNGMKVLLGRANSNQRFKRFVTVYQHSLHRFETQIAEMDMRYPNGLAVIWKLGQQPDFNGTV